MMWRLYIGRCRNWYRQLLIATSTIVSLSAVSCGSESPVGPELGTAQVTLTGALSFSGSAAAGFQTGASLPGVFELEIVPLGQNSTAWSLRIFNLSGRPATGSYNIVPYYESPPNPTANFVYVGGTVTPFTQIFNSTSGHLVITKSSASAVQGTFAFTATDASGNVETATGSFNAECTPGTTCQ